MPRLRSGPAHGPGRPRHAVGGVPSGPPDHSRVFCVPVRRAGQPEDIAHTVSFLVSEGAGFVSGQVIYVAGGPRD